MTKRFCWPRQLVKARRLIFYASSNRVLRIGGNYERSTPYKNPNNLRTDNARPGRAGVGDTMINAQPQLLQIPLDPGDVVYTPDWVARDMVDFFQPSGRILEPCKGDGVFLKYLPPHTEWCEIQEGRDFFKWTETVVWIVGNPPYKQYTEFIEHGFELADNILFFLPASKPFTSFRRARMIAKYGGIVHLRYIVSGTEINFPLGFPMAAIHFQRNYTGPMYTTIYGNET